MRVLKFSLVMSILSSFLIISLVSGQTSENVNVIGRWAEGPCGAVFADGNYAFIGNGPTFQILDLSDPAAPVLLGEVILPEFIIKIVTRDDYAYVVNAYAGLRILDISDLSAPVEVAYYQLETYIQDVALSQNYAYVTAAGDEPGVHILDISNPASPTLVNIYIPTGYPGKIVVDNNYAYMGNEWSLRIIDVSDPNNPVETGFNDGFVTGLAVSGEFVYVVNGSYGQMRIINVSDPANPTQEGAVSAQGNAQDVVLHLNYAYVANGDSGLRIIDISDPANPRDLASCNTPDRAVAVAVAGKFAYVADGAAGLRIIDAINPTQEGTVSPMYYPQDVVVGENYAYLADHTEGMKVIDISNPASPSQVGSTLVRGRGMGIVLRDEYAYIACGDTNLTIVDISNPANPTITGWTGTTGWAVDIDVGGNYAYVAAQSGGLRIINISNPSNPVEAGSYIGGIGIYGVDVRENYAYLADGSGLRIVNISNPASPSETGFYLTQGDAYGVKVSGEYAYVADYYGISVINISNPFNPTQITYVDLQEGIQDIEIEGAYAVCNGMAMIVFDITDPAAPVEVAAYEASGWSEGLAVNNNHAYLAASQSVGFEVVSLINPVEFGYHSTGGQANSVTINGNYAYVAEPVPGMYVLDISDPASPVKVGSYESPGYTFEIAIQGIYAYIADNTSLRVVNIGDPANPQETGSLSVWANDIALSGNYAFTTESGTINIIDISNPATPSAAGTYTAPNTVYDIAIRENYAYVACTGSGLRILNISNPISPVEVGFWDTDGTARGVAISGNYAYVADHDALRIIDISNPALPVETGSLPVPCYEIAVSGSYVCVSHEYNTDFQIIDVSDPENPQLAGQFNHGYNARGLAINGAYTYLAHGAEGIYVLQETIPPAAVNNLTAGGSSPSPWQRTPGFLIEWENPGDMSGISQAKYKIGSQPPTANGDFSGVLPGISPQNITVSQQGSQSLYLWLVDQAGNEDYRNFSTVTVRYDASISLPANFSESHGIVSDIWQNSVNNPSFSWTAPSDLSGINQYYLYFGNDPGGSVVMDSTSLTSFGFSGSEGTAYFRIRVKDNAGNISGWTTAFIFRYDNSQPTNPTSVTETGGAISDQWQRNISDPNFTWSGATDAVSGISEYWLYWGNDAEGILNTSVSSPAYDPSRSSNGTYYLRLKSEDQAGNQSSETTVFVFRHDGTGPVNPDSVIDITEFSQNNLWQKDSNDPDFWWNTGSDSLSGINGYYYYWGPDAQGTSTDYILTNFLNVSAVETGINYLRLRANDNLDNPAPQWTTAYTFKYDNIPPAVEAQSPDSGIVGGFKVQWTGGTDAGGAGLSGFYDVKVRDNTGSWTDWQIEYKGESAVFTAAELGHTYYFEAVARDSAGNIESFSGQPECSTAVTSSLGLVITTNPIVELSDNIVFNYVISNTDSLPTDISCEYSLGNDDDWNLATVSGRETGILPENYAGSITWLSYTDAPGVDLGTVRFKITPVHFNGTGLADSTDTFHLDNNRIPSVQIDPLAGQQYGDFDIIYHLYDLEQDPVSIDCEYFRQSSQNWVEATTTGDRSELTDYDGIITWHSSDDLPTANDSVKFRIRPKDNDDGISDTISVFINNVGAPEVLSISQLSGEQSGDITIDYELADNQHDNITLYCEYSEDSGQNWHEASTAGNTTNIPYENYTDSLTWHSLDDLPGIDKSGIRFRITPDDGNAGQPLMTNAFHLDNNLPPSVQINTISLIQSGSVSVPVSISDAEGDTVHIYGRYQTDGENWDWITWDEKISFSSSEYTDTLQWNSVSDLGFGEFNTCRIQLIPVDMDSGVASVSNTFDIFNYAGDYTADIKINFDDLIVFAKAWSEQDLSKEIGPAEGTPPLLIPKPDNKIDFEDLMVLVQQWNWSYDMVNIPDGVTFLTTSGVDTETHLKVLMQKHTGNNSTRYLWEKEYVASGQSGQLIPINDHLIKLSQSEPDIWSNQFGDELIFMFDSTASILGIQLDLAYDPAVLSISEIDNYLLDGQNGFTLKSSDAEKGKYTYNAVVLEKKEDLIRIKDRLMRITINPVEERQSTLSYRWKLYDISGKIITQGSDDIQLTIHNPVPEKFALHQNFPNPFNPSTTIRYQLSEDSDVQLDIYNILGERVKTLVDEFQKAGYYSRKWNIFQGSGGIASGVYFVRLIASAKSGNRFVNHKKLVVLK